MIRILFLGDIVGPLGRKAVNKYLTLHKDLDHIDFVIANGENTTHGHGLSFEHYKYLLESGVDVLTSGNHFYGSKDAFDPKYDFKYAIRPSNLDKNAPGVGTILITIKNNIKIRVSNLLGRVYITMGQENPFYAYDRIATLDSERVIHIIDFHAEATAEKRCFANYVDGKVTAVIGTHTHVQTNDSKFLNKGTFFLTDAGMNGAYDSCLGDEKEACLYRTMTSLPSKFDVPRSGTMQVNGVIMDIDEDTKEVKDYKLVNETLLDD